MYVVKKYHETKKKNTYTNLHEIITDYKHKETHDLLRMGDKKHFCLAYKYIPKG